MEIPSLRVCYEISSATQKLSNKLYYIVVISVMVAAWSVTNNSDAAVQGRIMIITGALMFYFSDIFVARERFVTHEFANRLIGLPLYYTGQFLLAFSPRFIG